MSLPRWLRAVPLLALVAAGACSEAGGSPPDLAELDGRTWIVTSITEDGVDRAVVDDTRIWLRFVDGRVDAAAGCGTMSADVALDGDELVLGQLSGHLLCEPAERLEQEQWLADLLFAHPSLSSEDDELSLEDAGTTVELRAAAPGDLAAHLEGRELIIRSIAEGGEERTWFDDRELRVTFDDGRIGASGGCNQLGAAFEVDRDVLVVDIRGGTEMACAEELMDLDDWLMDVLSATHEVVLDGPDVVLTSGPTTIAMTDRRSVRPDPPLVGTEWVLNTIIKGNGAHSLPRDYVATVTLADDGTFEVDTGCNTGSGGFEQLGPTTLGVTELETTEIGCTGDVGEVEAVLLAVLAQGEVEVAIGDLDLILLAGDVGAGFNPAP